MIVVVLTMHYQHQQGENSSVRMLKYREERGRDRRERIRARRPRRWEGTFASVDLAKLYARQRCRYW